MNPLASVKFILGASRAVVWRRWPYMLVLLFRLKPVERAGAQIMGVDDGLRLYYSRDLVLRAGIRYTPTLLAHEVQHPLRHHPQRWERQRPRLEARYAKVAGTLRAMFNIQSWVHLGNFGGDLEINDDMHGWEWPEWWAPLMPATFGLPDGRTMEFYGEKLIEAAEQRQEQEAQDGREPSGEADEPGGPGEGPGDEAREPSAQEEGAGEGPADEAGEDEAGAGGAQEDDAPADEDGDGGGDDGQGDDHPAEADGAGDAPPPTGDADGGAGGDAGAGDGADGAGDAPGQPSVPGRGCCGSCAGVPVPGEGAGDLPEPTTPDELKLVERQVAEAVLAFKGSNSRGFAPGDWLLRWAQSQFEPTKVDSYRVLARVVRGAVSDARRRVDWRMGPPSRRRDVLNRMPEWAGKAPILPVLRAPVPRVLVIQDTSGSMGMGRGSRLEKSARETYGFVRAAGGEVYVLAVDSQEHPVRRVRSAGDLLAAYEGGGGTNMAVGVRAAAKERPRPDIFILITDGVWCGWPTPEDMPRGVQFVTIVVNESREYFDQVPAHLKRDAVHVDE